jgi:hypothetical protein
MYTYVDEDANKRRFGKMHKLLMRLKTTTLFKRKIEIKDDIDRAIAQAVSRRLAGLPPRRPGIKTGSSHVGFVVDKVALGQDFPSTLVSPANFHSTKFSTITITYHLGMVQ